MGMVVLEHPEGPSLGTTGLAWGLLVRLSQIQGRDSGFIAQSLGDANSQP